ncbi:MAG: DUF1330 domain-containing protein [Anaerolineae bacterium]
MTEHYLEPTQESGAAFFSQGISGPVVMLNLMRFREIADYSAAPELAPETPISGREAYQKYMAHTAPFLEAGGGEVIFLADGGKFLIGPQTEQWDLAMLVRQSSPDSFMAFAQNKDYLAGIGHRTAAIIDSRLLPLIEST